MKVLILYDSYFGNTEKVAKAIKDELIKHHETDLQRIAQAKASDAAGYDLIVIGSPTRAFAPTRTTMNYAKALPKGLTNVSFAVFDTNIEAKQLGKGLLAMTNIFGYANDSILRILKSKKLTVIASEKFFVSDSEGPLIAGQEEKAREFSKALQQMLSEDA